MKQIPTFFLLFFAVLAHGNLLAQQQTVRGKVVDAASGEGLPGVSITVTGTEIGEMTDSGGNFRITAPSAASVLQVSYLGFITREISVDGREFIEIALEENVAALEEVVVTALGISQEKRALGYAVQEINTEDIVESRQANVVNTLQGKIAGVQVSSSGGAPGQSSRIIIRGINSLDPGANNQPLFVVDGVPIDNSTITVGNADLRGISNRAADLNPNDIESISVLKGGAATALYGVRAANGAIIVTTKKGKSGQMAVNFSSSYGVDQVNKFPDVQRTYTQGWHGVYNPDDFWPTWGPPIEEAKQIDPAHPDQLFNNYKNAYQTGNQFKNYLSLSGGTENATFFGSLSHFRQNGVLPFSNYDNISVKLSGNLKFSEKFNFSGSMNYVNSGGDRVNADRFNESLTYWSPRVDVNDFRFPDGTMKGYRNEGAVGNNPIYGALTNKFEDDVNRFIGNVNLTYSPVSWFDVNYRLGLDYYSDNRSNYGPGPRGIPGENVYEDTGQGFVYEYNIANRDLTSNLLLTFKGQLSEQFNATFSVGNDIFESRYERISTLGDELDVWDLFSLNNAREINTDQYNELYRIIGVYGILNLSFNDYLYLTATARNDWSSALPFQNRSFFYPSVSLGYVLSDHVMLPSAFNFAKIRASYAAIGKDTDPYNTDIYYESADGFPIENITGWTRSDQLGDANLKPESTTSYEIGVETRLLNNRLGFDLSFYKENSKDQILRVPISTTTGYAVFATNAGEIENRGVELILNGTPVDNENFSWDVTLNFSTNKNEVVSIREGIEEIVIGEQFGYAGSSPTLKLIPGEAYGNIYGTSYGRYGLEQESGEILREDAPLLIGADGFPEINRTQLILGNTQPAWLGGLSNSFRYKDFSLSFLFDVRQGLEKYNQFDNFLAAFGIAEYTLNREDMKVFEGFHEDGSPNSAAVYLGQDVGPDGVDYGDGFYRLTYRGVTENFIEDASWVRLRNVSLSYRLPAKLLENTPVSNASITFTGNNLWMSTPYSGFDPETSSTSANSNADGFTGFTYPGLRSYLFTLNVGF